MTWIPTLSECYRERYGRVHPRWLQNLIDKCWIVRKLFSFFPRIRVNNEELFWTWELMMKDHCPSNSMKTSTGYICASTGYKTSAGFNCTLPQHMQKLNIRNKNEIFWITTRMEINCDFQQVFLREVFFECGVQFMGLFSRKKKKNIEIRN